MRDAETYRGARRNAARAERGFPQWRMTVAFGANKQAGLNARVAVANGAREAASKALTAGVKGLPAYVVTAQAMLDFYRGEKRTRPVNRIIRDLERQVRAA